MNPEQLRTGILYFVAIVAALSVHEAAHGYSAHLLGDDTAKKQGRLTLNPFAHLDQLGTLMLAMMAFYGMGIGWAKPVPVNPLNFRSPRRDCGIVSFAGPFSNLLQGILSYWVLRLIPETSSGAIYDIAYDLMRALVMVNISLAAFNLLPVYPLDGQKVVSALLPARISRHFDFLCLRMGAWPLLIVIVWEWILPFPGPLSLLMGPVRSSFAYLIEHSAFWLG
jgi:Zn-dependent protease